MLSVKARVTTNELNNGIYHSKINLRHNAITNKFNALPLKK